MSGINDVINLFETEGNLEDTIPFKIGHINETYVSTWASAGGQTRYLHQRINHNIFQNVPQLMANLALILSHLKSRRREGMKYLTLVPTREGLPYFVDPQKNIWRTYQFIEKTQSFNVCPGPDEAYEAARACGNFLHDLSDLSPSDLSETIPLFHHTPNRFKMLKEALSKDPLQRAQSAKSEIAFALAREAGAGGVVEALAKREIPLRAVHNDLKLNNVLFDTDTGKAVSVVDLDTCMAGASLYDFGDLVRSTSISAAEDETDLARVRMDEKLFEALTRGYLEGSEGVLNDVEIGMMSFAPRLIALALGVRFLTDHLLGDQYFGIQHQNHNLERARTQFTIVEDMEGKQPLMDRTVAEIARQLA